LYPVKSPEHDQVYQLDEFLTHSIFQYCILYTCFNQGAGHWQYRKIHGDIIGLHLREYIFYYQCIFFCEAVYAESFHPHFKSRWVISHFYLVIVFCGTLAGGISPDQTDPTITKAMI